MFPVTLQDKHDNVLTVWPPCYGFLQHSNYHGGDDCDEDDDYYDPITYEANEGWTQYVHVWDSSYSLMQSSGRDELLSDLMSMEDIRIIWNSGTHIPMRGKDGSNNIISFQYAFYHADVGDEKPKNAVELWAEYRERPDVTVKSVMEALEAFMDKDRPSCLVWHEKGFMGVVTEDVSEPVPADRCLFYLMVNRLFYQEDEQANVWTFLDKLYMDNWSPLQALAYSRLINAKENLFGEVRVAFTGNEYDNCLFPVTLYTVGIGANMAEPRQTAWRQPSYMAGEGHFRDEDYQSIWYDVPGHEEHELYVNNSMFLPILQPEALQDRVLKEPMLIVAFAKAISLSDKTRNELLYTRYNNDRVNTYTMIRHFQQSNLSNNSSFNVLPSTEWDSILTKLFLGN